MTERYLLATEYLIDLLRAFGHRTMLVNTKEDGQKSFTSAFNFVKYQLDGAGIRFPYNKTKEPCQHVINPSLSVGRISIIMYEAVFTIMVTYVEAYWEDDPTADEYIDRLYDWIDNRREWMKTAFHEYSDEDLQPFLDEYVKTVDPEAIEEARQFLASKGITEVETSKDINQLFWKLAFQRQIMEKEVVDAIRTVITNYRLLNTFNYLFHFYNSTFHQLKESDTAHQIEQNNKMIIQLQNDCEQLRSKLKKEKNKNKQEVKMEESAYRKLTKKFFHYLQMPGLRFYKAYDFTSEADITEFLSWFKMVKRPVGKRIYSQLIKHSFKEDPQSGNLFMNMVEKYNLQFSSKEIEKENNFDDAIN